MTRTADSTLCVKKSFPKEWEIIRKIGNGSCGQTFLVRKENGLYCLKVVKIDRDNRNVFRNNESIDLHMAVNEAEVMEILKNEEHVVHIEDAFIIDNEELYAVCILMEYLTVITDMFQESCDESEVIRLGIEICTALAACKDHNIIHQDIKAENLFINKNGSYKLGDFGIARNGNADTAMMSGGTLNTAAPEVCRGEASTYQSDIYSLGMTMYKLMNNNHSPYLTNFENAPARIKEIAFKKRMREEYLPVPVNASEKFSVIILKACARDPEKRYGSADEMKEDLMRL